MGFIHGNPLTEPRFHFLCKRLFWHFTQGQGWIHGSAPSSNLTLRKWKSYILLNGSKWIKVEKQSSGISRGKQILSMVILPVFDTKANCETDMACISALCKMISTKHSNRDPLISKCCLRTKFCSEKSSDFLACHIKVWKYDFKFSIEANFEPDNQNYMKQKLFVYLINADSNLIKIFRTII